MVHENWQLVTNHSCLLGEGPVWDAAHHRILWLDIVQGEIHQFYPESRTHKVFKTGALIGAVVLREQGGLIAALQNGLARIDMEKGTTELIAEPEKHLPDNRFNDGKCDPAGRFWAGTMSVSGVPGAGSLYVLETDHSVSLKLQNIGCSNGLAWSPDAQTLYYIDTPTRKIAAFDFDVTNGAISNKRIVITIPESDGYPDGMTIDSEGMLWIAMWDGWKVCRYNPHTAEHLENILLPVSRITSCTFGGDKLQDLYITSARTGLSESDLFKQPLAGNLFVIKNSGFTGIKASEFTG